MPTLAQSWTWLWLLLTLLLLLLALVLLNWRQGGGAKGLSRQRQGRQGLLDPTDLTLAAGLVSRVQFDQSLEAAVMLADPGRRTVCVLCIKLDNFELVNEQGSGADADRVLAQAAQRLRLGAGGAATITRLGVAEFVLLLPGDLTAASRLAGDCRARLGRPYTLAEHKELILHASIGIAAYPQHGSSSHVVAFAGHAMQAVQRAGGDDFMVFAPQMAVDARERAELRADLRQALEKSQFELYYQPKVQARSLQITAAGALIRWRHPQRGLLSPSLFMPLAEGHGLIADIGNWAIDAACGQAALWRDQGLSMQVAIKLSGDQMRQHDLVDRLQAALRRHQLQPERLSCEISESVAMDSHAATQHSLERLRDAGLPVSIDEFGLGGSSQDSLRRLPASELKINASLVGDLGDLGGKDQAAAVISAAVQLGHVLGLRVVAAGVDTAAQRDRLVALGCDELQGVLIAGPMTAQALSTWALLDASDDASDAVLVDFSTQEPRPVDE